VGLGLDKAVGVIGDPEASSAGLAPGFVPCPGGIAWPELVLTVADDANDTDDEADDAAEVLVTCAVCCRKEWVKAASIDAAATNVRAH